MKLDDLDQVTKIRNHRQQAIGLRDRCNGYPIRINLGWQPDPLDVASVISVMPIRETIKREAEAAIANYDKMLRELGVEP